MTHSKSSILTYKTCPRKYKYQYIDKIRPTRVAKQLLEGNEKHDIFESTFKNVKLDKFNKSELIDKVRSNPGYSKYSQDCENFINKIVTVSDCLPEVCEFEVKDEELNFKGFIDVVFIDDKGNRLLLDYKTGKSDDLSKYRFELALYSYCYTKQTSKIINYWGIFFSHTGELVLEKVNQKEIEKSLSELKNYVGKIEYNKRLGDTGFPRVVSGLCKWKDKTTGAMNMCDYYHICNPHKERLG